MADSNLSIRSLLNTILENSLIAVANAKRIIVIGLTFVCIAIFVFNSKAYYLTGPDKLRSFQISFEEEPFNSKPTSPELKTVCDFPDLNPFDESISGYIEHPSKVACKQFQPHLTFIDIDGFLQTNESEVQALYNKKYTKIRCIYKPFDRALGLNDNGWVYTTERELTIGLAVRLKRDMVDVSCSATDSDGKRQVDLYRNVHAHPALRKDRLFNKPTEDQLSVLFMGIDSVAYSVLQRNMPITFDYIKNKMNMHLFRRFNKIGDNTFPNLFAALTGKRIYDEQQDMPCEVPSYRTDVYFDTYELIWKYFAAKGYATVFNEDMPDLGLFHYLSKGFTKKPVDFYYHTYWHFMQEILNATKHQKNCFGNTPKGDILLDITKRHLMTLRDSLQFIFSFFVELSHDEGNEIERADSSYAEFWREMFEDGYLNKTVVIFMSDHGHRFSNVRKTLVGLLEERNPFFGIWFPEWFYKLHPRIKKNLLTNTERLSSTFDIHETLKDILYANYESGQKPLSQRGLSLLYDIPLNRTCRAAGVPDHYCLCTKQKPLNTSLEFIKAAAIAIVDKLNVLLNESQKCHKIRFQRILRGESVDFDGKVKEGIHNLAGAQKYEIEKNESLFGEDDYENINKIRLVVETEPNKAIFEAMAIRQVDEDNSGNQTWIVGNDIQRLNAYKTTSYCVRNAVLRKYCSCKTKIK